MLRSPLTQLYIPVNPSCISYQSIRQLTAGSSLHRNRAFVLMMVVIMLVAMAAMLMRMSVMVVPKQSVIIMSSGDAIRINCDRGSTLDCSSAATTSTSLDGGGETRDIAAGPESSNVAASFTR